MWSIGHRLIRLPETPSTIDVARTLADEGAEHGTVVLAERQTAGRGRRGRAWTTLPGKSLATTVVLRELPNVEYLGLAGMAAALGVVHAAKQTLTFHLQTKWPNDVVAEGKKVAGTLAERHGQVLLLSLGLNINGAETDLPPELRDTATTLELVLGRPVEREQFTTRVLAALDECWRMLLLSPRELIVEWERVDMTKGKDVAVVAGRDTVVLGCGRALGVDSRGRLRVLTAEGNELLFDAGDVTLAQTTATEQRSGLAQRRIAAR